MSAAADEAVLPLIASLPLELFECVCYSCSLQSVARLACTSQRLRAMSYRGVLPLTQMPDYRLIQLLVEEVLYVYEPSWIDIFWCPRPRLEPAASGRLTSAHAPAAAGR